MTSSFLKRPYLLLMTSRHLYFRARTFSSGCFDAFTVFAFLAFMLALLDLILELQMQRRKRRSLDEATNDHEILNRNATLASHFMMRGFLNTLDSPNQSCAQKLFCQGVQEASKLGLVGKEIANISRYDSLCALRYLAVGTVT